MTRLSWLSGSTLAWVAVIACGSGSDLGSGSGIPGAKKLTELSASEQNQLCAYTVNVEGGPHAMTCGDLTVYVGDIERCVTNLGNLSAQCQATVNDVESCAEVIGVDPCNFDQSACGAYGACAFP